MRHSRRPKGRRDKNWAVALGFVPIGNLLITNETIATGSKAIKGHITGLSKLWPYYFHTLMWISQ